jgi:histidinol-phosphate aminotransferase
MAIEFNTRIREIPSYPAADGYALGEHVALLASNESPELPLPEVVEAAQRAAAGANRYPDPSASLLRARLSDRYGVPTSRIALGNGSCDILLGAAQAMLEPGAEIVYAWPSFSMYPHLAALTGARAIAVPLTDDGRHDLEAMLREITAATRICLICNPNNPTGTALPLAELEHFANELPRHVALIVDEAYVEFNLLQDADDSLDLLKRHENVVLLRTFSKVYGLCGLRVGYALCPPGFRDAVDRIRQPFSVNTLAQVAATEALRHQDEVARRVERTAVERLHIESELEARGLAVAPSQANFSWVGVEDEDAVMAGLESQGVIVRSGGALGDPGHLRVTYGTREENDRFLAALDDVLNK